MDNIDYAMIDRGLMCVWQVAVGSCSGQRVCECVLLSSWAGKNGRRTQLQSDFVASLLPRLN